MNEFIGWPRIIQNILNDIFIIIAVIALCLAPIRYFQRKGIKYPVYTFFICLLFLFVSIVGMDLLEHIKLPAAPRGVSIDTFVENLQLPEHKPVDIGIDDPIGNVKVFSISYGVLRDCEAGCFSSYAVGIQHKDKIGLISYRDYDDLDPSKFIMYNFDFPDAYLFSFKFALLLKSKNEWLYERIMEGLERAPLIVKWQIRLRQFFSTEQ